MNEKIRWRAGAIFLSFLLLAILIWNTSTVVYFQPNVTDGTWWSIDEKSRKVYIQKYIESPPSIPLQVEPGDTLLAINNHPVESISAAWKYVGTFRPGTTLHYKIKRGERILTVPVLVQRIAGLATLSLVSTFVGFLFLLVGFIVIWKKPYLKTPRLFFLFSISFFLTIGMNIIPNRQPIAAITEVLVSIGLALWGPTVLLFFMNFPLRAPVLHKYPGLAVWLYLPSVLLIAAVIYFQQDKLLITVSLIVYFSLAFYSLIHNKKKIINPHEQKSLNLILIAMTLGLVPMGALALFSRFIIHSLGLTPVSIVFSSIGLVPIAFGYSIMRYGLMDVEIIIKKSLIYTFLTISIVLLYFLLVVGLGGFLVHRYGISGGAANLVFLLLVALLFQPVQNNLQKFIDKRFFRDRYQYQQTLLQLSQKLPGIVQVQDVLRHISETISTAMHVLNVGIYLYEQERKEYTNKFSFGPNTGQEFSWREEPNSLISILKREKSCCLFYKIEEDSRYHNLPVSDKLKLEKMNISLAVPMFYKESLLGLITLGPKQSGQVYNQEDMDLLVTVAGNAAIALVNARLHQEDLKKQRLENELLLARHIQLRLLPEKDPEYPGVEIVGTSKPATIVGGDYYDYIPVSTNQLFLLVGDVSGKGMPAALYMSKVQGMVQVTAGVFRSPQQMLSTINRHLYGGIESKSFVTMLSALLHVRQKKISICRAGHMPVYLKRDGNVEKITGAGIGLGLDPGDVFDQKIEETNLRLKPRDYLIFFTDGLVEAMNPERQMFGEKRLETLLRNREFNSAAGLRDLLLQEVQNFQAGAVQNDDITVVVLKVK